MPFPLTGTPRSSAVTFQFGLSRINITATRGWRTAGIIHFNKSVGVTYQTAANGHFSITATRHFTGVIGYPRASGLTFQFGLTRTAIAASRGWGTGGIQHFNKSSGVTKQTGLTRQSFTGTRVWNHGRWSHTADVRITYFTWTLPGNVRRFSGLTGLPEGMVDVNTLHPWTITSSETWGLPRLQLGYPATITVIGIASAEAFGTPRAAHVTGTLHPSGISTAEAFGTPGLILGLVITGAGGIPTAQWVPNPYLQREMESCGFITNFYR